MGQGNETIAEQRTTEMNDIGDGDDIEIEEPENFIFEKKNSSFKEVMRIIKDEGAIRGVKF